MAKLTIEVPAEEFEAAIEKAYQKRKGSIVLQGFRKGKAPRRMIEKMYGKGVFYEDAANSLIPEAYDAAYRECEEEIVSRPSIDVTQIEAGQPFIFTAEVALKPAVTLGEYKGLEVEVEAVEVTEAEVDAEVQKDREKNARTVDVDDRAVEDGDIIKLDFDGYVDGEAFDGGKASDYPLTIGSHSFIPGFEEQLIGANIGEDIEVNVTFPEEYQAEHLAGKPAVFKCKVNAITRKELPEVDDEFAQDVSEFDTVDEYKKDILARLTERKENAKKSAKESAAVEKAAENAEMDIPEAMVDEQVNRMMDDFSRRISSQGITMEQYLQFTGMTQAALAEQSKPEALKRIKNSLVLEAIAKAENIAVEDEKVDEQLSKMAEQYKMEVDKLKELMGEDQIADLREQLAVQAAVDLVRDSAVEVEKKEEAPADTLEE